MDCGYETTFEELRISGEIAMPGGYIKLQSRSKKPIEKWREKQYAREELAAWIATGHNIGFATGTDDVVVLDIDNPARVKELEIEPPYTYRVKTGSGGFHLYYKIKNAKKVVLFDLDGTHLGELQCMGQYVVTPPSIHPNGIPYKAYDETEPITEITQEELLAYFSAKIKVTREVVIKKDTPFANQRRDDPLSGVSVDDVWNATETERHGGQSFCEHPIHKSSTGRNLVIHPGKNTWACMRCHSGGGAAMAIAVKYGILQCYEALPGALRGDKFLAVLQVAREHGLIEDETQGFSGKQSKEEDFDD